MKKRVQALANTLSVIVDPTGTTGDAARGHAVMVTGSLSRVGLTGYGIAVWTGSAWVQVPSTGLRTPLGLGQPARAYRNAAFTWGAGGTTIVPVDTASFDPGTNFDVATNNRYNVPTAGYYLVTGEVIATATVAGQSLIAVVAQNGAAGPNGSKAIAQAAGNIQANVCDVIHCAANDTLQLAGSCSAALAMVVGSSLINYLSVIQVA